MNLLYILGNGFDINLGLKTRYSDFYRHYCETSSPSELIEKFKKDLKDDIVNWSDLELQFGKYCSELKDVESFIEVFENLGDHLAAYLQEIENGFDFKAVDRDLLLNQLPYPEKYLTPTDLEQLTTFKKQWKNHEWLINIITLNYTKSIEKIIDKDLNKRLKIGDRSNIANYLNNIEHLHGYVDERMVLGINDLSQLNSEEFKTSEEITDAFVKSECNKVSKHGIDRKCTSLIQNANIICLFGSSIGDTDKCWWELIGKQLIDRDIRLIIYYRSESLSRLRSYKLGTIEREQKRFFLSKTGLNESEYEQIKDKIYIGVNTQIFKLTN